MSMVLIKDLPLFDPSLSPQTVCGRNMTAEINWYPHSEHCGKPIYFCTEFCLDAFNADPDRFYAAHSRKKDEYKPA